MKVEIIRTGEHSQPVNISLLDGSLSLNKCNVTFEPGDFEAKEVSISGSIINVPKGCNITDQNGTNLIRTIPDESTHWLKCDKGYFGISSLLVPHLRYDMPGVTLAEDLAKKGVSSYLMLFDLMKWAVQNSIPYKISTVEPE